MGTKISFTLVGRFLLGERRKLSKNSRNWALKGTRKMRKIISLNNLKISSVLLHFSRQRAFNGVCPFLFLQVKESTLFLF